MELCDVDRHLFGRDFSAGTRRVKHPSAMDVGRLMTLSRRLALLMLAACPLVACDQQASTDYRGEPLLSVSGSIHLTRSRVEGALVPAIAFENDASELHFLDVEVAGEFPSTFTFHVYEPPPEAAFLDAEGPRRAVGYITALAMDHAGSVQTGVHTPGIARCGSREDTCRARDSWCTNNGEDCYYETTVCEHASSPTPDCTTEISGSEELRQTVFSQFEGLAFSHQVLYLDEPAEPDSEYAIHVGQPEGLSPGYHLFRVGTNVPTPEQQIAAFEACERAIRERAVEIYNDKLGTELTYEDVYESEDIDEETLQAVRELEDQAGLEAACVPATEVLERIDEPLSDTISVVIGPELTPQ
jgi:hypothetical protein